MKPTVGSLKKKINKIVGSLARLIKKKEDTTAEKRGDITKNIIKTIKQFKRNIMKSLHQEISQMTWNEQIPQKAQ